MTLSEQTELVPGVMMGQVQQRQDPARAQAMEVLIIGFVNNRYMRHIVMLTLILVTITCHAQTESDLKTQILKLDPTQPEVQVNLKKAEKRFDTGTMFIVGGLATAVVTGISWVRQRNNHISYSDDSGAVKHDYVMFGIAGGLITTGMVLQIDSRKFTREGRRKKK